MTTDIDEQTPFAVHRAAADLLKVLFDGRGYDAVNPYSRTEIKSALTALAGSCGADSWMDTDAIFQNAPLEGPVPAELCKLAKMFILGENYNTKNPYARPEVKGLLKALADDTGVIDPLDTKTIFERIEDPEMAELKREEAARQKSIFNSRILEADIAFLTAQLSRRITTIGEWSGVSRGDSMFIRLGIPEEGTIDTLEATGIFTVKFHPQCTKVAEVTALRVDTGESLLISETKTLPKMGI